LRKAALHGYPEFSGWSSKFHTILSILMLKNIKSKSSAALCCRMLPLAWTHASSQASISLATRSTYRRKSMLTAPMNSSAEIPHRISKIPANDLARTAIGGVFGRYCGDYLRSCRATCKLKESYPGGKYNANYIIRHNASC
jgi:hypothetical protein